MLLNTLNGHQLDGLLEEIQRTDKLIVLGYLLRKAKQWTSVSDTLAINSSDVTKDRQIRSLMNKQTSSYSPKNKEDKMLIEMLLSQQPVLSHLI